MSWGYRITLLTLSFVGFMMFMVISAFRQNFDLVAEDYYGKELQFQNQIEKQTNQQHLKDSLICVVADNNLIIKFPAELAGKKIEGEILFFRPSDAKKDFKQTVSVTNGVQLLAKEKFTKGKYLVQVDYKADGIKYYAEKTIMIQ